MRTAEQSELIAAACGDGYVPWQVHWDLTYACQLKCQHCYQMNLDWNRKGELSTGRVLETLDELVELGTQELTFSGGDPFVRKDFLGIVERACAVPGLAAAFRLGARARRVCGGGWGGGAARRGGMRLRVWGLAGGGRWGAAGGGGGGATPALLDAR